MYHFRAYGLVIASEIVLPNMRPADPDSAGSAHAGMPIAARADITVVHGEVAPGPPGDIGVHGYYGLTEDAALYFWRGVGRFSVMRGSSIVLQPDAAADAAAIRNLVMGSLLAIALYQRGIFVLHGSAVAIAGRAVGFVADSGGGKSTTAAAFMRAGAPLVADDHIAIELRPGEQTPAVYTSYPQMKLWAEALTALGRPLDGLEHVVGARDKRIVPVEHIVPAETLPPGTLYILAWGDTLAVEDLAPNEALVEIVRNSYIVKLIGRMGEEPRHFRLASGVAARAVVRRLVRPRNFDTLDKMVELVRKLEIQN